VTRTMKRVAKMAGKGNNP